MKYSHKKYWLPVKMLLQFPKLSIAIYTEHQWLKQVVKQDQVDLVISDNRFWTYHAGVPSVYITQSVTIKTEQLDRKNSSKDPITWLL